MKPGYISDLDMAILYQQTETREENRQESSRPALDEDFRAMI